jgi:hypothetical protein
MLLALRVRPRVYSLGWPHLTVATVLHPPDRSPSLHPYSVSRVEYGWAFVQPDGSGWSLVYDDSLAFLESELESVIEAFYESSAGPYPFDFEVFIVPAPIKQPDAKHAPKKRAKKPKKPGARRRPPGRSKPRTGGRSKPRRRTRGA